MKHTCSIQKRKRKIAVVVPKYGLVGGGERFAFEVTERLARNRDWEFHVFANRWEAANGSPVIFHKVPMISFPRSLRPFVFPWFAEQMIKRGQFDLVHSHDRIFRADIISLHCVPHEGWVQNVRKKKRPSLFDRGVIVLERQMLKNGSNSWFLPVSSLAEEEFRRHYPSLPGKWQIVHPGVDVTRFSSPDREACRAEVRQRHGIPSDACLILFVGMNFEVKGLDTIIDAVATVRQGNSSSAVHLLVVGRGDEQKYGQLATQKGIANAVTFAGTQTHGIERYFRAADIFTMLSRFDTFGMVVLEAMAAGLPVIVSPTVGAADLVSQSVNGFVTILEESTSSATAAILQLLDPDRRSLMGKAALATAAEHDWDKLVEGVSRIYEQHFRSKEN